MKIIIVNYRFFISGGPERYLFSLIELLERNGHEVIPFSIKNKLNRESKYSEYFLDPVGDDEVYFKEYDKKNIKTTILGLSRMFYSFEAKKKLTTLILETKPDLIYVLHYQNKISISIFDAAKINKIPVIHRVSDFGQICANAHFYRPIQEDVCERCLSGSKINAVKYKCVNESYIYSAIKASAVKFQQIRGFKNKVEALVVPSKFTLTKLGEYGIPNKKLHHIPTFFNFSSITNSSSICYGNFALYIGRIEKEKGIFTLIKAFENTPYTLKIIGFSSTGYDDTLKSYLKGKNHNIEFLGKLEFKEIQQYLLNCLFTVVPSEWYDNFPNSVLESYAFKKCVVATNLGSLKEMIDDNVTGLLFENKSVTDLSSKMKYLFSNPSTCRELGENAYEKLLKEYSENKHYEILIELFKKTIKNYNQKAVELI